MFFDIALKKIFLINYLKEFSTVKPRLSRTVLGISFVLRGNHKKALAFAKAFCGPTWARTRDHLIMSQVL